MGNTDREHMEAMREKLGFRYSDDQWENINRELKAESDTWRLEMDIICGRYIESEQRAKTSIREDNAWEAVEKHTSELLIAISVLGTSMGGATQPLRVLGVTDEFTRVLKSLGSDASKIAGRQKDERERLKKERREKGIKKDPSGPQTGNRAISVITRDRFVGALLCVWLSRPGNALGVSTSPNSDEAGGPLIRFLTAATIPPATKLDNKKLFSTHALSYVVKEWRAFAKRHPHEPKLPPSWPLAGALSLMVAGKDY